MPRTRAAFARSAADRDLHLHLGKAATAVRAAMDVCGRASRGRTSEEMPYREQQKRLARAEKLLNDIGHLDTLGEEADLKGEARALCSWLESRERTSQVVRPSRRGTEYQQRLHQVLGFLAGNDAPAEEEPTQKPEPEGPPDLSGVNPNEMLWGRATELARQQGEGENDAYIEAIFRRLVNGVTDGEN